MKRLNHPLQRWMLTQPFKLFGLLGLVISVVLLALMWQQLHSSLQDSVTASTQDSNNSLTQVFVNESWAELAPMLPPAGSDAQATRDNPRLTEIDALVRKFSRHTDVVKVKIYNVQGLTIYSSDPKQIGHDDAGNPGFQGAVRGIASSELTYRGSFGAFDGHIHDRNLVSTYGPIRTDEGVVGVAEIYADRTRAIELVEREHKKLLLWLSPIILFALGTLGFFAWQFQKIQRTYQKTLDELAHDIAQATDVASNATHAQTQMMSNLTHEIRTPVAGILGLSELLASTESNPRTQSVAQEIAAAAGALTNLLNDSTELADIQAGQVAPESMVFDVHELLGEIRSMLAHSAEKKGLQLQVHLDPQSQSHAIGDRSRLRRVLMQLVNNAIRFTQRGQVQLKVFRADDLLHFDVIDTGIGMTTVTLAKLFTPFHQADHSSTRQAGGTGLGLAICQGLVREMGGEIAVQSTPDHGSWFSFSLPLPAAETPVSMPGRQGQESTPPSRLLVAEDNPAQQMVAVELLERLGHTVDIAPNGQQAVHLARQNAYDLILMDVYMPDMDGLEATRQLRAQGGKSEGVCIVAISANISDADKAACRQAGMDDFLGKPFHVNEFKACLARHLGTVERAPSSATSHEKTST
ncbi:MAG: hypothetical protein RLZZ591_928 [Pseudomonadota bacterium]|jgi:signal transduction histidine kinase/ActR/RegA family two-component response regulator